MILAALIFIGQFAEYFIRRYIILYYSIFMFFVGIGTYPDGIYLLELIIIGA